jgi:YHS domain-containing protein
MDQHNHLQSHAHQSQPPVASGPGVEKDPVCGMAVPADATLRSEFEGRTYRFCSRGCLERFEKNPLQFVKPAVAPKAPEGSPQGVRSVAGGEQLLRHPDGGQCDDGAACGGTTHAAPSGMATHGMPSSGMAAAADRRWLRWGLGVFLLIAFFFLWQEHRAHLLGALPWLLLLACPLMHMLMHRRHGSRHEDHATAPGEKPDEARKGHAHGGHGCC